MAKIIRMSPSEAREWRQNIPQLIRPDGTVERAVTQAEESAIQALVNRAKKSRNSLEAEVLGKPLVVKLHATGNGRDHFYMEVFYDIANVEGKEIPLKKVAGRDVIKSYFTKLHGQDVQLKHPNGTFAGMARLEGVERPTYLESGRLAPKPENCTCRDWGDSHPDQHHPACPYNAMAPHDERGTPTKTARQMTKVPPAPANVRLTAQDPEVTQVKVQAPITKSPSAVTEAPAPDNCQCTPWVKPHGAPKDKHHPVCQYFRAWELKNRVPRNLVDLETGTVIRPATVEEIGEAEVREAKTGSPLIIIGEATYAVLPEGGKLPKLPLKKSAEPVAPPAQE